MLASKPRAALYLMDLHNFIQPLTVRTYVNIAYDSTQVDRNRFRFIWFNIETLEQEI